MKGYDNVPENEDILLDLPLYEGVGTITRDQAKPHHQDVDLILTPTWDSVASGLGVITLDGLTNEYLNLAAANCIDLDFTSGDYSIGGWINWSSGETSQIILGRYELDVSGWEVYLTETGALRYLSLRHHHAAGAAVRTACYSLGWAQSTWCFFGISRSGAAAIHYKNGVALATTHSVGGLEDIETCGEDLAVGIRYTKDANRYKGSQWRPRVWNKSLTANEWLNIFEKERDFFGV